MATRTFDGLTVVVTGGAGALGSAVVKELLEGGASCVVSALTKKEADSFTLRDHERVTLRTEVNLADEAAATAFFASIPELWASVNVAGGFEMSPLVGTSLEGFRRMIDMNLTTCFLACREGVQRMRPDAGGRIVNVSAKAALTSSGGMAAYTASKGAVATLTECLAEELRERRIWVNAVAPSIMDTPANRKSMPGADHSKWTSVEAVARTVCFLASPDNCATTGGVIPVDG